MAKKTETKEDCNKFPRLGSFISQIPHDPGHKIWYAHQYPFPGNTPQQFCAYFCDDYSAYLMGEEFPHMVDGVATAPKYPIIDAPYQVPSIYREGQANPVGYLPIYWGVHDRLISHFINRRIAFTNKTLFKVKFQQKWHENKPIYSSLYKVWDDFYHGLTLNTNEPAYSIFMDYYHTHSSEFTGSENRNGTNTGTVGVTGSMKDTSSNNTTTSGTAKNTSTNDSTSSGTNTGTVGTTTSQDSTNTNTADTTSANTGSNRVLESDTPQSIVNASTTGNPDDIKWTYASKLTDNIQNTKVTNTGTVKDTNETTGSSTTTNDLASSALTNVKYVGDTVSSATTEDTGSVDRTSNSSTTNDLKHTDVTSRNDSTRDTTSDYRDAQAKVEEFLSSPFSRYFFQLLCDDFEELFLPMYFTDDEPYIYTWKEYIYRNSTTSVFMCDIQMSFGNETYY